jgi:hypothetical protein
MSAFRFLGHVALFMIVVGTASQAVAAPFGYSGLTSPSETFPPLLMVQYSDRGRASDDRDYRDRYRPNDDRADGFEDRNGDGSSRRHGRGASFFLRVGDTRIAARCSNGETMRACVDATLMLLEKAKSLQSAPTEPSSQSGGPPSR